MTVEPSRKQHPANTSGGSRDEYPAEHVDQTSDAIQDTNACRVPQEQEERILCGGAESGSHQGGLDISVAVQEPNEPFNTAY